MVSKELFRAGVENLSEHTTAQSTSLVTGYCQSLNKFKLQIDKPQFTLMLGGVSIQDQLRAGLSGTSSTDGVVISFKDTKGSQSITRTISPRSVGMPVTVDAGGKLGISGEGLDGSSVQVDLGLVGHRQFLPVIIGQTRSERATSSTQFTRGESAPMIVNSPGSTANAASSGLSGTTDNQPLQVELSPNSSNPSGSFIGGNYYYPSGVYKSLGIQPTIPTLTPLEAIRSKALTYVYQLLGFDLPPMKDSRGRDVNPSIGLTTHGTSSLHSTPYVPE